MTQNETTIETQYRIHWRVASTGATGCGNGTFTQADAELWVKHLNQDKDNVKAGLTHWAEPVPSGEHPSGYSEASCQGLMASK